MTKEKRYLWIIIAISALLRALFAVFTELSNDEAFYRILALYPSNGYYAHPPMVAWLAHITTLGASVAPEILIRLSSVIIGTINTYLIFKVSTRLSGNEKSGLIAALLYTASAYATIFIGITLLPDCMLSLCWIIALDLMVILVKDPSIKERAKGGNIMLLLGAVIGIGLLSKYTAGYLAVAWVAYVFLFDRGWLRKWQFWGAWGLSIIAFLPVIIWNLNHDFASIAAQSQRLLNFKEILWWSPWRELGGNFGYQNPINYVIFIFSIIFFAKSIKKGDNIIEKSIWRLLLITSLPMILFFFIASFTQPTLPHWSAPAYFSLILLASLYLLQKKAGVKVALWSASVLATLLIIAGIEIKFEPIPISRDITAQDIGKDDITLDMYGWKQGGTAFANIYNEDIENGIMSPDANIIHTVWYEGAHLDNYFALPLNLKLLTFDNMDYGYISEQRGGIDKGSDAYFISSSRTYLTPYESFSDKYLSIDTPQEIPIYRGGRLVEKFYVYRLHGAK